MRRLAMSVALACSSSHARALAVPDTLKACTSIVVNVERLACYDIAMAQLAGGHADSTTASAPQFVFGLPAEAPEAPAAGLMTISANVSVLRIDAYGAATIELDNGQAWHQVSGDGVLLLAAGDRVSISRGALGSFLLTTAKGRSAKVRRIR